MKTGTALATCWGYIGYTIANEGKKYPIIKKVYFGVGLPFFFLIGIERLPGVLYRYNIQRYYKKKTIFLKKTTFIKNYNI